MDLEIVEREAVRALLLTPQREILLLRIQLPDLDQCERYYAVETERFAPRVCDPVEAKVIERLRWWPIDELAHARERLTPLSLADIVARYLLAGAPIGELEPEVLVD
jgi:hypothetical protein